MDADPRTRSSGGSPEIVEVRGVDEGDDSVLVRRTPVAAMAEAAGWSGALALAALIIATATILTMSAAAEFGDAKLYSSRGLDDLEGIRWIAGTRLVVAGVALLLAVVAGVRYARRLPATRFAFSGTGEDPMESQEGDEQPAWMKLLVGSSILVAVFAILLNGAAFAMALHLHMSPNFGVPRG